MALIKSTLNADVLRGKYFTNFPFENGTMKSNFTGTYGYGFSGMFDVSAYNSARFKQTSVLSSNQLTIFKVGNDGVVNSEQSALTANTDKVINLSSVKYLMIFTHTQQSSPTYTLSFT